MGFKGLRSKRRDRHYKASRSEALGEDEEPQSSGHGAAGVWSNALVSERRRKAHAQGDNAELRGSKIANECLERTGDEGRAIREANAVVARRAETGQ
jgi:hypothetical protein